ncbi:MAG: GNAT family N-acetyltransferase [Bacteroidales bacterium]|nr:GNAT family N-acetyltransferase [Bacteroidales bacterium]
MIAFTETWNQYLDLIPTEQQDLYFREEYVRLYETDSEKACCFVYQDGNSIMLFPFLRREFQFNGNTYYDFETAYGYGGPISNDHSDTFMTAALEAMSEKALSENFVCGFVRFHPLLENWDYFEKVGRLIMDRKTIAIDLSDGIEATWMNEIHTKNRNVIKKGEKNGLEFIVDEDFAYLPEFEDLYNSTMDKLEADGFYYFDPSYYDQLKNTIQNKFLGIVKHEGKVVAGAIFFYQLPYGHYHLAGSDKSALKLSPNNYLLWEAAKELTRRGVKHFHLGGGTDGSEENSLYQYKRKFSKHEYQFALGKMIFNPSLYEDICAEWAAVNPEKAVKMKNILLKYKY